MSTRWSAVWEWFCEKIAPLNVWDKSYSETYRSIEKTVLYYCLCVLHCLVSDYIIRFEFHSLHYCFTLSYLLPCFLASSICVDNWYSHTEIYERFKMMVSIMWKDEDIIIHSQKYKISGPKGENAHIIILQYESSYKKAKDATVQKL